MKIAEIMTKNVITVSRDTDVCSVEKIMHENKVHSLPVMDGKRLVGIITETDFFTKGKVEFYLPSYIDFLANSGINKQATGSKSDLANIMKATAGDIMTGNCTTLTPENDVKDLLQIAKEKNIHTFPVVSGEHLKGIVTVADIIKLL